MESCFFIFRRLQSNIARLLSASLLYTITDFDLIWNIYNLRHEKQLKKYVFSTLGDDPFLLIKLHSPYKMMFCNHRVEKVWIPLHSIDIPTHPTPPPFVCFSHFSAPLPALLLKTFFWQYHPNVVRDKRKK